MSFFGTYKRLLKKHAWVRFASFCLVVCTASLVFFFTGQKSSKKPIIISIDPPVGLPHDILTIQGSNFGSERETSFVEIAGSHVTGSKYLTWTDSEIQLELPENVQDGLVIVTTASGQSEPAFFANKSGIPVSIRRDPKVTVPVIQSVTPEHASVGETITITGSNFGNARGSSTVYFAANRMTGGTSANNASPVQTDTEFITANQQDFDYVLWTDSEIQVRIPDGADTGNMYIRTERGKSPYQPFTVDFPAGKKQYGAPRTYVVQTGANLQNDASAQDSLITLYMPRPAVSSFQPVADLNTVSPDPLIEDDVRNLVFQCKLRRATSTKQQFSQTSVIKLYTCRSNITGKKVGSYTDKSRLLYKAFTTADACVPSADSIVTELRNTIIGKEKNPYAKALRIYEYMIENYRIKDEVRTGDVSVLDLPKKKNGDAYDFAILFTALCRSAGIPAVPMCGILAENQNMTKCHWWTEIYFEKYGWFPVDVSLGAGLQYNAFTQIDDAKEFFFGNLDSQHIAFSRGWNQIRPSGSNSKIVQRPRSYALQSIWEEAGDSAPGYSSLWTDPLIIGIY